MRVDIWSDVVCPWCYVGKRQFELGLAGFAARDEVEVVYHAFELDPSVPPGPGAPIPEVMEARYGMSRHQAVKAQGEMVARAAALGLPFTGNRVMGNSFDAHRLVRLGRERGVQATVLQGLYEAYFGQGQSVFGSAELTGLAGSVGLDPAEAARVLADGTYADSVREDEAQARELGITGVPFTVLDRRYAVSGAQPPEAFADALDRAWRQRTSSA